MIRTKNMKLFWISAFFLLCCSGPYEVPPPELTVDCRFTETETKQLQAAVDEWAAVFPELSHQVVQSCDDPTIVIGWPVTRTDIKPATTSHHERIWMNMPRIQELGMSLQLTALHELGHYFGIRGHLPAGNVLSPNYKTMSQILTNDDILAMSAALP